MSVDPATAKHQAEHDGHDLLLLLRRLPREIRRRPRALPRGADSRAGGRRAWPRSPRQRAAPADAGAPGRDLHLPDASGDPPGPPRRTARSAAWRWSRRSPREATGPNAELVDMTRRFWIALALAIPGRSRSRWAGISPTCIALVPEALSNWIQLALATPVVLWAGWPFFVRGWASLMTRNLNMFTLIAMGIGVAWAYSVVATVAPGLFPPAFRGDARRGRRLFRGGGGHHRSGAARAGAGAAGARADRRRDPRAARSRAQDRAARPCATARTRTSRSTPSRSAIGCACGRARRSRSTAWSSRAAARSTNPC